MIWLSLLLMALPVADRITPPEGGCILSQSDDLSMMIGWGKCAAESHDWRLFAWTPDTGVVWLDKIFDMEFDIAPTSRLIDGGHEWRIMLQSNDYSPGPIHVWVVRFPKDTSQWFRSADFDRDGDVDQSDFGMWQRQIGSVGAMSREEFQKQMTGAR